MVDRACKEVYGSGIIRGMAMGMAPPSRLGFMVRALGHRNYRLFFLGQGTSLVGTWITRVATSWLVYHLSGSAFLLGLAAFALHIPLLVLGPFAGVWVDRRRKRMVLLMTQSAALAQSVIRRMFSAVGGRT